MHRIRIKEIDKKEAVLLGMGCVIYALSMSLIRNVDLIPGSLLGVAVTMEKLIGTPVGAVNLLLNLPILGLCTKVLGKKALSYTVFIMACTSLLMDLVSVILPGSPPLPPLIASLSGGAVMGLGAGLLLVAGGTMAGTTALSRILHESFPRLSVGNALLLMDSIIILGGCAVLKSNQALLYSLVYTMACSKTIDLVYLGSRRAGSIHLHA